MDNFFNVYHERFSILIFNIQKDTEIKNGICDQGGSFQGI